MTPVQEKQEGVVKVCTINGHAIWTRTMGASSDPGKLPLLCLHGGPGASHDYLEPLEAVAASGRQVIFYDQLGCGKSDHPQDDPSLQTMEYYLGELAAVRTALGLDRVHIFGQSWGGMLAMQYALGRPEGVASLTLAGATASSRQWGAEAGRLRAELPPDIQQTLAHHEKNNTTDDPAYGEAMMVFYRRHVCRLDPWPDCLNRSMVSLTQDPGVYLAMWGPSEFHITGNLRDWDITDRLGEITIPTLITCGRHDEATPAIARTIQQGIPGSRCVIFEHSGHEAHIEEADLYIRTLVDFLEGV
ncbi:MAG: alpha/beta fold hydrolase [Spartobacteria bacterium]|nr:alpha/beta fold hydrolase [Spartobacteria bacterium]